MKKQLLTSAIAGCFLAASGTASAGGAVEALTGTDINGTKITQDLGIDFGGWVSAGFAWNTGDPSDNRNGPVTFNDRDLEFQMNQLNLFISEEATAGDNYDLGFRADVLFGTDANYTQATGLDDKLIPNMSSRYDLAIPQVYAELYAPIGNGVT
ncbi:MAG: outer membrane beta-barrel protein, partial [Methylococcales bacterium]|nr:outer membrane beta-barrel protein [Methylococcales bacterium]